MRTAKATDDIEELYRQTLEQYLSGGGELGLRSAYEVGRLALASDVGLLELATLQHSAIARILASTRNQSELETRVARALQFFWEILSPYEMTHRGYHEGVAALRLLNETLELEVKRIAHSIHDEAGQLLAVVDLALAELSKDVPPALQTKIKAVTDLLQQVENQLRGLSHELRPTVLDDLGLVPAIRFLAGRVSKRFGLEIHLNAEGEGRLLPKVETALYRIIQEALNNVSRHAQAKNVWVELRDDTRKIICSFRDDGVGFDDQGCLSQKQRKGLGLLGIQERVGAIGGTLRITSEPGRGTRLLIMVPKESSRANTRHPRR